MQVMNRDIQAIHEKLVSLMFQILNEGEDEEDARKLNIADALGILARAIQEGRIEEFTDHVASWGEREVDPPVSGKG
jgi:hypothetical protein